MPDVIRPTRQRQIVADALAELETFCSAQEIHALLTERGETVGLATVYRTLQLFAESGNVDALHGDDGETRYRQCSSGHHHHLVCRACGRTVEVEGPTVERWADRVSAEHGFTQVSHQLEIFGNCPECS
jgi:Fur family transcriptional regulator, ferric uptake regulator